MPGINLKQSLIKDNGAAHQPLVKYITTSGQENNECEQQSATDLITNVW